VVLRSYVLRAGEVMRVKDRSGIADRIQTCPKCNRPGPALADDSPEVAELIKLAAGLGGVLEKDLSKEPLLNS
jgi:hypothetical protein